MPECGEDMNDAMLPIELPISRCSNEDRFIHISAMEPPENRVVPRITHHNVRYRATALGGIDPLSWGKMSKALRQRGCARIQSSPVPCLPEVAQHAYGAVATLE